MTLRPKEQAYEKARGKKTRLKIAGVDTLQYNEEYVIALETQLEKAQAENKKLRGILQSIEGIVK